MASVNQTRTLTIACESFGKRGGKLQITASVKDGDQQVGSKMVVIDGAEVKGMGGGGESLMATPGALTTAYDALAAQCVSLVEALVAAGKITP